jgi:hypothetical protein
VVSKVLEYSLNASKDEHIDQDYLYRDSNQEAKKYSSEYVAKRKEEERATFIEDMMDFETGNLHFAGESDTRSSMETEATHTEKCSSEPSSKRRYVIL